jgi:hypothetical protein
MDNLADLLSGAKLGPQHEYFRLAKNDIYKLAYMYSNYNEYDANQLSLINNIKLFTPDLYQLNIVIQYIITYGNQLFLSCLTNMKVDSYNKVDCEQYIDEYIEDLSSFVR